jgi:hypothetical protein
VLVDTVENIHKNFAIMRTFMQNVAKSQLFIIDEINSEMRKSPNPKIFHG